MLREPACANLSSLFFYYGARQRLAVFKINYSAKSNKILLLALTIALGNLIAFPLSVSAQTEEDRSQKIKHMSAVWMKRMKEAEELSAAGKFEEAEALYRETLKEREDLKLDLLTERIALAKLYEKLKRKQDAAAQYKNLIEERRKQAGEQEDITVAFPIREYAAFLKRTGDKTGAAKLEADVNRIEKDSSGTASDVKKADAIVAGSGTAVEKSERLRKLGAAWLANSDGRKAMVYLDRALKLNPKNVLAYCDRGQTFYYNGDEKSALKDYKSALAIDSKCGAAYFNIGRIMSGRKNYSGAIAQYSKAIACEPENIEYLGARGKLYDTNGDHNKAIADYTKVLQIRPSCIWARVQRATAYDGLKDFDKAAADLSTLVERYPDDADFYEYRGKSYLGGGKFDNAIADYSKVVELSPAYAGGYVGRARAYEKLEGKDSKKAKEDFSTAAKFGYSPR